VNFSTFIPYKISAVKLSRVMSAYLLQGVHTSDVFDSSRQFKRYQREQNWRRILMLCAASFIFSHDWRRTSGFSVICLFRQKKSSVFSCKSYFVIGSLVDIFGENGLDVFFVFDDITLNSFFLFFQRTIIMDFFSRACMGFSHVHCPKRHTIFMFAYYALVCTTFFFASGFSHFLRNSYLDVKK